MSSERFFSIQFILNTLIWLITRSCTNKYLMKLNVKQVCTQCYCKHDKVITIFVTKNIQINVTIDVISELQQHNKLMFD